MPAGRPPGGVSHVMPLDGFAEQKHRLRVILDVLSGALSVRQACELLRVSESRFHQLRTEALQGALDSLAPRPSGRPRSAKVEDSAQVEQLREQIRQLELELQAALVRTELALAMPQVLMDRVAGVNKKNSKKAPS